MSSGKNNLSGLWSKIQFSRRPSLSKLLRLGLRPTVQIYYYLYEYLVLHLLHRSCFSTNSRSNTNTQMLISSFRGDHLVLQTKRRISRTSDRRLTCFKRRSATHMECHSKMTDAKSNKSVSSARQLPSADVPRLAQVFAEAPCILLATKQEISGRHLPMKCRHSERRTRRTLSAAQVTNRHALQLRSMNSATD